MKYLLITAVLISAAVLVFFLIFPADDSSGHQEIRTALNQKQYKNVSEIILQTASRTKGKKNFCELIDISICLAEKTGNYLPLKKVSEIAVNRHKRYEPFWGAKVYSDLRTGDIDSAAESAASHLKSDTYSFLKQEIIYRAFPEKYPELEKGLEIIQFDPGDPENYELSAGKIKEEELYLNSCYLWMAEGEFKRAMNLVSNHVQFEKHPSAVLGIYYSAGASMESISELVFSEDKNITIPEADLLHIKSDIAFYSGDFSSAAAFLLKILKDFPEYSWRPYINLAFLLNKQEKKIEAVSIVNRAYSQFTGHYPVEQIYAVHAISSEQEDMGILGVNDFFNSFDQNLHNHLCRIYCLPVIKSIKKESASLWKLLEKYDPEPEEKAFLSSFFYNYGLYADAGEIIRRYSLNSGREAWSAFFSGAIDAADGKYESAFNNIEVTFNLSPSWETAVDAALIKKALNQPGEALQWLQTADRLAMDTKIRSDIRYRIAELLYSQGNIQGAKREALYAKSLYTPAIKAELLLKKLEDEIER